MMFSTNLFYILTVVVAAASGAIALPAASDVFSPQVTAPHAGDVWAVGSVQTVTWDTSSIPPSNQGETGLLLLGFIEDGSIDEHLDTKNPLAANFQITDGAVNVTVPGVAARDDYVVVLFGDSGNTSPKFTITN